MLESLRAREKCRTESKTLEKSRDIRETKVLLCRKVDAWCSIEVTAAAVDLMVRRAYWSEIKDSLGGAWKELHMKVLTL